MWQDWFRTWDRNVDDTTSRWSSDHSSHFTNSWCELMIKIHSRWNPTSIPGPMQVRPLIFCIRRREPTGPAWGSTRQLPGVMIGEIRPLWRMLEPPSLRRLGHYWGANSTTLLFKDALHICIIGSDTLMNRDEGIPNSNCWMAILSHTHAMIVQHPALPINVMSSFIVTQTTIQS